MIFSGRIEDDVTKQGIPDVNIQIPTPQGWQTNADGRNLWRTDSDGYFSVDLPGQSMTPNFVFSSAAYEKTYLGADDFYQGIHVPMIRSGDLEPVEVVATHQKGKNILMWYILGLLALFYLSKKRQ